MSNNEALLLLFCRYETWLNPLKQHWDSKQSIPKQYQNKTAVDLCVFTCGMHVNNNDNV